MWTFFSRPLVHQYMARPVSGASLFTLACWTLNLILPLVIIYRGESGLWDKFDYYYEQPRVAFEHEYFVKVYFQSGAETRGVDHVMATSHMRLMEEIIQNTQATGNRLRLASTNHQELDLNGDGSADELRLSMEIPLDDTQSGDRKSPVSFQMILFFSYAFNQRVKFSMDSLVATEQDVPAKYGDMGVESVSLLGDLALVQRVPLPMRMDSPASKDKNPFFALPDFMDHQTLSLALQEYATRNITTKFNQKWIHWSPLPSNRLHERSKFTVNLNLTYPLELVHYQTGFWHLIIWAWIQYLSLFVVLYFGLYWIRDFVFAHNLLGCLVYSTGDGSNQQRSSSYKVIRVDRPLASIERLAYK